MRPFILQAISLFFFRISSKRQAKNKLESTRDFNEFEKRWEGDSRALLKSKNYSTRKCESQTTLGLLVTACLKNLGQR